MPRRRITGKTRRSNYPRLNASIWEWLEAGRPTDELGKPIGNVDLDPFAILGLEKEPFGWEASEDPNVVDTFWKMVEKAVLEGRVEIVEDFQHCVFDAPLFPELQHAPAVGVR